MNPRSHKRELSKRVAKKAGISQTLAMKVVNLFLDELKGALIQSGKVELREFGCFAVRRRAARVGRNPRKPDVEIPIPPRWDVSFKPSQGGFIKPLSRWMQNFDVRIAINRAAGFPDYDGCDKRL